MDDDILSFNAIERLAKYIEDQKNGLAPEILSEWYNIIGDDFRSTAPEELKDTFKVTQDPILPQKFKIEISRRAVQYLIRSIERNLPKMPYATYGYFHDVIIPEIQKKYTLVTDKGGN
ncbi:MAG: hypothetical protein JRN37_04565 [Nitrososphaerota archaeon]|jgi:hypothetical protein|nr:hypothetical protein [Nitrososphaerota archaeon]MDG7038417.1 hypothetical protein [Nitrososphaerota archaeon]